MSRTFTGQPTHKHGKESYQVERTADPIAWHIANHLRSIAPLLVHEALTVTTTEGHARKACKNTSCTTQHLKGSVYCAKHDPELR